MKIDWEETSGAVTVYVTVPEYHDWLSAADSGSDAGLWDALGVHGWIRSNGTPATFKGRRATDTLVGSIAFECLVDCMTGREDDPAAFLRDVNSRDLVEALSTLIGGRP